jgi:hypothetical protein
MKLVKRTYRITEAHDKFIKKESKKYKVGQNEIVRALVDALMAERASK